MEAQQKLVKVFDKRRNIVDILRYERTKDGSRLERKTFNWVHLNEVKVESIDSNTDKTLGKRMKRTIIQKKRKGYGGEEKGVRCERVKVIVLPRRSERKES